MTDVKDVMAIIFGLHMTCLNELTQHRSDRLRRLLNRASGFFMVVLLLCLWEISARLHWVESPNWPPISHIIAALRRNVGWRASRSVSVHAVRYLVGFSVGVILAVVVGILMASVRSIDYLLNRSSSYAGQFPSLRSCRH